MDFVPVIASALKSRAKQSADVLKRHVFGFGKTHGAIARAHRGACVFHTGTISGGGQIKAREIFKLFLANR
jgi:hypothetical protein